MPRFFACTLLAGAVAAAAAVSVAAGCGSTSAELEDGARDAGTSVRRDSAPVDPSEAGGEPVDASSKPPPDCRKYCALVMSNCGGEIAQYASEDECLAFCAHLPPSDATRKGEEKSAASLACRQYWADSPAQTDPNSYCLAAGPFGGNVCGDRCTAFCSVLLGACTPDGGVPAYESQAACASACAGFAYRDAGTDGGGEGPDGPATGDTLNCRLYHLRAATQAPARCVELRPDGGSCR